MQVVCSQTYLQHFPRVDLTLGCCLLFGWLRCALDTLTCLLQVFDDGAIGEIQGPLRA